MEDNAGNYQKAFDLYKIALEYFSTHLKYEKNPRAKEAITAKARAPLQSASQARPIHKAAVWREVSFMHACASKSPHRCSNE